MSNPDFDPFADDEKTDNQLSVTFKGHGGYDAPWVVLRGSAEFIADKLGVKEFDGKVSTLMKQVVKVDAFYKKELGEPSGKG